MKAILLYIVWFCTYDLWLKKVGAVDDAIIDSLVYLTANFLEFFDYMIYVDHHKIGLHGAYSIVFVGKGCNALELFALFSGFILIFEGNWRNKLWYIPLGVTVIHLLNVGRILALIFLGTISKSLLEFNHKYTFTIIMYIVTFIGWMIWVKYFANKSKQVDEEAENK
ncbi:MAG: hypothetical protein ACPGSO_06720 [Vicingaceae bacterium]